MTEIRIDIPLIDEAAHGLKKEGRYSKAMSQNELAIVMKSVVDGLLSGQDSVRATVPRMDVKIADLKGHVAGSVNIQSPISATIDIDLILGNSTQSGKLELVDLKVEEHAGFLASIALGAVNVEGKAREKLKNPNAALSEALGNQLSQKGVILEDIRLLFQENNTLGIEMKGKAA